ncbi:MAG: transcriptional regulator NrdR [Candidatus Dojkabacteria bacterium]|jgi:transcriptional repressor NrdR|nr:transcriptional regulator NrdR [Candidatus Dojkabacteria bacterium]MDD2270450.1 transcriptional regulator NrdR [Candidatus Dojkabacteria bacterium]
MKCPYCGCTTSKVVDKRDNNEEGTTRRRRQCLRCGRRYTTYERIEKVDVSIVKKDGSLEKFDCEKLKKGIMKAVQKDKIPEEAIEEFCEEVERRVLTNPHPLTSIEIGEMVLIWLRTKDPLAYIRFASIYKNFESIKDFKEELDNII